MDFETRGFDALQAKLAALKVTLSKGGMERVVRAGAAVFKREMVSRAPEIKPDTAGPTSLDPGALRNGIGVTVSKRSEPVEARVGPRGKALKLIAYDVEYGHRSVSKSGTVGRDVPPHPFIRPAYESGMGPAETAMAAEVDLMVREADGAQ